MRVSRIAPTTFATALVVCLASTARAEPPQAQAAGQARVEKPFEVTARLLKIPAPFAPDELYDYAYVMKYQVVGGPRDKQEVLVAHYKPRRPRSEISGKMRKHVAGSLRSFREGDVHRLTLDPNLRKVWRGALIDEFFAVDRKSVRYWALRADPADRR